MNFYRLIAITMVTLVFALSASLSTAQAKYPVKPITLVVGFPAGGGTDLIGRALAKELRRILGKPVTVINKPGAASMIAAKFVADSRPDGYVLWFGSAGTMVLKTELGQTKVDFFKDFKLAGFTGQLVPSIAVPDSSPLKTVKDLIDAAHANPGKLRWAHGGRGSAFMAAGVGFAVANSMQVVDVPFAGARNKNNAIFAKQVDFGITDAGDSKRFPGKMRCLAAIRDNRDAVLDENLPTLGEQNIDFISIYSPVGVLAPKGVPDEIVSKLADAIKQAVATPGFNASMNKANKVAYHMSPTEGIAFVTQMRENVIKILPNLKK